MRYFEGVVLRPKAAPHPPQYLEAATEGCEAGRLHWFAINGEEERPLFAFMTTEPNELAHSINHERMPVLISDPIDFKTWLSGSPEEAFKLARSYAAEQMRIVQHGAEREDLLRLG